MKNKSSWSAIFLLAVALIYRPVLGAMETSASVQISAVADFEAPLTAHGSWIEVRSYGHCWRPSHVEVEWRPYASGEWVWTDCGWYWESDEPWGWACYHYGNWVHDSEFGWVWIPDTEWSPAWVSWRWGGGYCGWAPLPPRGVIIAPTVFVFVETRHFHERIRPTTVIVNNTIIINKTTEIRNARREMRNVQDAPATKVVVNDGPKREDVEKATGNKIRTLAMRDVTQRERGQKVSDRPTAPAVESKNPSPNAVAPVTPVAPTAPAKEKEKEIPATREKISKPENPASKDKPAQPYKPLPPANSLEPSHPAPPVSPEHPAKIKPLPKKPSSPVPPDRRDREPRPKEKDEHGDKEVPHP